MKNILIIGGAGYIGTVVSSKKIKETKYSNKINYGNYKIDIK